MFISFYLVQSKYIKMQKKMSIIHEKFQAASTYDINVEYQIRSLCYTYSVPPTIRYHLDNF